MVESKTKIYFTAEGWHRYRWWLEKFTPTASEKQKLPNKTKGSTRMGDNDNNKIKMKLRWKPYK